jgi:hypothetical protein
MLKECIHSHPEGTLITETEEGILAENLEIGYSKLIPRNERCLAEYEKVKEELQLWKDNAYFYLPN